MGRLKEPIFVKEINEIRERRYEKIKELDIQALGEKINENARRALHQHGYDMTPTSLGIKMITKKVKHLI